jgi:uncharacterized DUF497 family protein
MSALHFEWDASKARDNLQKHGVSFVEAESVFTDDMARLTADPDHSINEDRFVLLGMSDRLRILVVVHCDRKKDRIIRLISARRATAAERAQYEWRGAR